MKRASMNRSVLAALAATGLFAAAPVRADEDESFEDKHVFGFTQGTDVGEPGGREAEFTTQAGLGKRGGSYGALLQEAAFEGAASDRFGYELIASGAWRRIAGASGLDSRDGASFSGLAFQPKAILLRRGVDAPFGLALSLQPEWQRADDVSGERASALSLETRLYLDAEFIPRKLLGAVNLIYRPERQTGGGEGTQISSLAGASGGLSYFLGPEFCVGGEAAFYRASRSAGFAALAGSALYLGPSLNLRMGRRAFLSLAWSAQVSAWPGRVSGPALAAWNQADLARQRAQLVLGVEF
jgi:hypothetical protein